MGAWQLVSYSGNYPETSGLLIALAYSLRQKLPFDDDEFDHVHIHGLAYAVPENKVCIPSIHHIPY